MRTFYKLISMLIINFLFISSIVNAQTLDQDNSPGVDQALGIATGEGQSFTAGLTGKLNYIDLYGYIVDFFGCATPSVNLQVNLRDGDGLAGTILATSDVTIVTNLFVTGAWERINFSTPPNVVSGQSYTMEFIVSDCSTFGLCVFSFFDNAYPDGSYYTIAEDICFRTYVTPFVTFGNALDFDGTNDYVDLETISTTGNFSTGFTFEGWINYRTFNTWSRIMEIGNGVGINTIMIANGTDNINFLIYDGVGTQHLISTGSILSLNTWTHIACSVDATGFGKIYINGNLVTSGNLYIPDNVARTSCFLGNSDWPATPNFDGLLDEIRIWNVERTQAEIQANMFTYYTGSMTNLMAYYRLDQGDAGADNTTLANELIDYSGNCNKGTLTNFTLTGATSNWVFPGNSEAPILTTTAASAIDVTTATLNGNVFSLGETAITTRGFQYSTSACFTTSSTVTDAISATGAYNLGVTSLSPSTTYYYRSFATNTRGTSYGETQSFTTSAPAVTTWQGPIGAWSNGAPIATQDAIIDFLYDENINIVCKDLTINVTTGDLQIQPTYSVTVNGNLVNNGSVILVSPNDLTASGSLITLGTITNTGTMRADRRINADQWHLMASPLNASTLAVNPFMMDYVYTYNEGYSGPDNDLAWDQLPTSGATIDPQVGYLVKSTAAYNTNFVIPFEGTFNTGTIAINNLPLTYQGYNLIANPYPSAIDVLNISATNIFPTIWIWNSTVYATFDGLVGTNGGSQYIPAMQGFFVQALNTTNDLTLSNTSRVHNPISFKNTVNDLLKLTVSGNGFSDEIALYFEDNNDDSKKFFSWTENIPQIYSIEGENKLSINKLQDVKAEQSVNLGLTCEISGNYTITANEFTFNPQSTVVLEDLLTGIFTDLTQNATYNFDYIAGSNENRFVIHFNYVATNISKDENNISVYSYAKNIYLNNIAKNTGVVEIYNVLGQNVLTTDLKSVISTDLQTGIYIVKIQTEGQIISKKIFIQ